MVIECKQQLFGRVFYGHICLNVYLQGQTVKSGTELPKLLIRKMGIIYASIANCDFSKFPRHDFFDEMLGVC
jgi:hypothetical protein